LFGALLTACSSDDAGEPPPDGTPASSAASGGTPPAAKPVMASFLQESGAGNAPALVRFSNDTKEILSLSLGDQAYTLVPQYTVTGGKPAASVDLLADAIVAYHSKDTCIRVYFDEIVGANVLEPGHAYTFHVTLDDGWAASIEEDAMPAPFTALRPLILDPAIAKGKPTVSRLSVDVGDPPAHDVGAIQAPGDRLEYVGLSSKYPGPFWLVSGESLEVFGITFTDRNGTEYGTTEPIVLRGSGGFTLHVDDEVPEGALESVELAPL
jgi:hypothetical protein